MQVIKCNDKTILEKNHNKVQIKSSNEKIKKLVMLNEKANSQDIFNEVISNILGAKEGFKSDDTKEEKDVKEASFFCENDEKCINNEFLLNFCFLKGDFSLEKQGQTFIDCLKQAKGIKGAKEAWLIYKHRRNKKFLQTCFDILIEKALREFDFENKAIPNRYKEISTVNKAEGYIDFCGNFKALIFIAENLSEYKTADALSCYFNKLKEHCMEKLVNNKELTENSLNIKSALSYFDLVPPYRKEIFAREIKQKTETMQEFPVDSNTFCYVFSVLCENGFLLDAYTLLNKQTGKEYLAKSSCPECLSSLVENLGGIRTSESSSGFSHIVLRPFFIREIEDFECVMPCSYGNISVNWKIFNNTATYNFNVPRSTTVILPDGKTESFLQGTHRVIVNV